MLPGEPFIVSGHNQRIAWGLTNVMNDDIDFYKETILPQDSNTYKFDGKWLKMHVKTEEIAIRGGDTLHAKIRYTHRGPIVSGLKGVRDEVISMRWLGNEMSNEVRSIYFVNRAGDWNLFKDAMKTFISVSQNVAYADINGNIGLYCCAGIPVRKAGNPITILPGDTSAYDWTGLVPFDSLPHCYNPAQGFVVSANNKTIGKQFPYYISNWFDLPFRYNRIHELLRNDSILTTGDFKTIQTNFTSGMAPMYLSTLLDILVEGKNGNDRIAAAWAILNDWDCNMYANYIGASVFEVFYNEFIKNLVSDELGERLLNEFLTDKILVRHTFHNTWMRKGSVLVDNKITPAKETFEMLVIQSMESTIAFLQSEFGEDPNAWEWGKLHNLTLKHPLGEKYLLDKIFNLNRGPFPVGGSFHTVAPYTYKFNQLYKISSGASQRHIYDLSNWDNSFSVIPTGNSGIPGSENYCNQTQLYLEGKYHHDWFTRDKIIKNHKYKFVFSPGK
jgi:penicillin amidase